MWYRNTEINRTKYEADGDFSAETLSSMASTFRGLPIRALMAMSDVLEQLLFFNLPA